MSSVGIWNFNLYIIRMPLKKILVEIIKADKQTVYSRIV